MVAGVRQGALAANGVIRANLAILVFCTPLDHERGNDAMEGATIVVLLLHEREKVGDRLRRFVLEQLERYFSFRRRQFHLRQITGCLFLPRRADSLAQTSRYWPRAGPQEETSSSTLCLVASDDLKLSNASAAFACSKYFSAASKSFVANALRNPQINKSGLSAPPSMSNLMIGNGLVLIATDYAAGTIAGIESDRIEFGDRQEQVSDARIGIRGGTIGGHRRFDHGIRQSLSVGYLARQVLIHSLSPSASAD